MKKSQLLIAAVLAAGTMASASAQTVINITGATAFREAAHRAIIASISNCVYGYQGTNLYSAGRGLFKGDIDVGGTPTPVIVRTSWSGSVAGIRAVTTQSANYTVSYYDSSNSTLVGSLSANGTANLNTAAVATTSTNKICFADNVQSNTPFTSVSLDGGAVGVIAFVPVMNENTIVPEYTSISTLQLRRLMEFGSAPLKFITGNFINGSNGTVSDGIRVYWTGRNSLSGTRAIYLSEMGVGASKPVIQYIAEPNTSSNSSPITALQIWPVENTNNGVDVWSPTAQTGNATAGNGGYDSGGLTANIMMRAFSSNVTIKDATGGIGNGTITANRTSSNTLLCTVLSAQEVVDIQANGGRALAYNGVSINPDAYFSSNGTGGITATDREKITNGRYTLWSYENLFYRQSQLDDTEQAFVTLLETNVPNHINGNGVKISDMRVSRTSDGGKLTVLGSMP